MDFLNLLQRIPKSHLLNGRGQRIPSQNHKLHQILSLKTFLHLPSKFFVKKYNLYDFVNFKYWVFVIEPLCFALTKGTLPK